MAGEAHLESGITLRAFSDSSFLLPSASPVPPMMNQSSAGERFVTRAFTEVREAKNWLSEAGSNIWQTD